MSDAGTSSSPAPAVPGMGGRVLSFAAWLCVLVTVAGQLAWPLASGAGRLTLTIGTVITFFFAGLMDAWQWRGWRWAAACASVSLAIGWAAEALGTASGIPFGSYHYTSALGPALLGVPLLIPLAWSMMAYPCLVAAQLLVRSSAATAVVGGLLLASWDLFLDPQMVQEGYWVWHDPGASLPGIPGIPWTNFAGWIAVAVLLISLLDRLPRRPSPVGAPLALLSWTWIGSTVAAVVFFDRPGVALWGGLSMGMFLVPAWYRAWRTRR